MQRSVVSRTFGALLVLLALTLVACSGGDGGTEPQVATRLAFQVQPVAAVRDTAIPVAIKVAVLDQNDDVLTSATNTITVALDVNAGSATLTGTTSAAAVNGVATFTGLTVSATGNGYRLAANSPGLAAASSGTFSVTLSLADVDGDGLSPNAGDCNDSSASIKPGALDRPDGAFVDSNCDGFDGDTLQAIFVHALAPGGPTCGARATPCTSIQSGIARAVTLAKRDVYVGPGTYANNVVLANGVSIYGGFSATWARGTGATTQLANDVPMNVGGASPQHVPVYGASLTQTVIIADLSIISPYTSVIAVNGAGLNTYGIILRDVAAGVVTIERVQVFARDANAGANGADGTSASATAAPAGIAGDSAAEFNTACNNGSRGAGGAGATNPSASGGVDASGGTGGNGGTMDTDCGVFSSNFDARPGLPGANAAVFQALVFGFGGMGGSGTDVCGLATAGAPGRSVNGAGGAAGAVSGTLVSGLTLGANGGDGMLGEHGTGGGGGGGGGGCDQGTDAYGPGGGGGGAGGARASVTATGGFAGGSTYGIYLINASPTINAVSITRGNAGAGGAGGTGGSGQSGGLGGAGGLPRGTVTGGRGGDGAHGGHGGGGAGGAGGQSIGILRVGTSAPVLANVTYTGGSGGAAGAGGASAPNAPVAERDGNAGQAGPAGTLGTVIAR